MIRVNEHYGNLRSFYLFSEIGRRVRRYQAENPGAKIIRFGIGDVTLPLPKVCVEALHRGADEMGDRKRFKGYGPEQGYEFLREAIRQHDFAVRGVSVGIDEIFVSDGAKCDTANFQELFASDSVVALSDPVYPVYLDSNIMAGRSGAQRGERFERILYLDSTEENGFVPEPPNRDADLAYLCFPNNPTGAVASREQLSRWVAWARERKALILFDAAYEEFIRDPSIPHSIFEIPGADEVAVEFRSFSKTAGFTGLRCAYTVVPKKCMVHDAEGNPVSLNQLWDRRQTTKFNGVSYPVQLAAAAIFTPEGRKEIRSASDYYLENAALIGRGFTELGYRVTGGKNSPYLWVKTGGSSWDFFDLLLRKAQVVTTPGSGFGTCGEGYIRVSAFNDRDQVVEGLARIASVLGAR